MPIERGECHVLRRRREIITVGLNSSFSYPTSSMLLSCRRVLINLLASTTLEIHSPGGGEEEIMFHPLEQREKRGKGEPSMAYTVHSDYLLLVHFSCLLNLSRLIRSASPLHGAMKRGREGASLWIIASAATSSRGLLPSLILSATPT